MRTIFFWKTTRINQNVKSFMKQLHWIPSSFAQSHILLEILSDFDIVCHYIPKSLNNSSLLEYDNRRPVFTSSLAFSNSVFFLVVDTILTPFIAPKIFFKLGRIDASLIFNVNVVIIFFSLNNYSANIQTISHSTKLFPNFLPKRKAANHKDRFVNPKE